MPIFNPRRLASTLNWISVFALIWLVIMDILPWQSLGYLGLFTIIGIILLNPPPQK